MKNPLLDLYSDYLISSFALATATGLSLLLDNEFSHDQITRFLSGADYTRPRPVGADQADRPRCRDGRHHRVFVKIDMGKDFVMALKSNRAKAVSSAWTRWYWEESTVLQDRIKGVPFPVMLVRQAFTNKDGSTGVLYLASSDLLLDYGRTTLYQKRWNVEVFHKSIKSNAGLARSPTHTVRTRSNHFFRVHLCALQTRTAQAKASDEPFRPQEQAVHQSLASEFCRTSAARCVTSALNSTALPARGGPSPDGFAAELIDNMGGV